MARAQITGAAIVRAIDEESQQTRRGVTPDMAATLVNAGGKNDRARVAKMLSMLRDEGSLRYHEGRYWATELGLAGAAIREAAEQTSADSGEVPSPACTGCDSQEGEYHNPECPAVNAFMARRIPAEVGERPDGSESGECIGGFEQPEIPLCADCDAALSADELKFYETRCEVCERATEYDDPEEAGTVAHPQATTESGIGSMLDALVAGADPATHHDQALQAEVVELLDGLIERTHDRIKLAPRDDEPLRELLAHCESIRARTMRAFFVPAALFPPEASQ